MHEVGAQVRRPAAHQPAERLYEFADERQQVPTGVDDPQRGKADRLQVAVVARGAPSALTLPDRESQRYELPGAFGQAGVVEFYPVLFRAPPYGDEGRDESRVPRAERLGIERYRRGAVIGRKSVEQRLDTRQPTTQEPVSRERDDQRFTDLLHCERCFHGPIRTRIRAF